MSLKCSPYTTQHVQVVLLWIYVENDGALSVYVVAVNSSANRGNSGSHVLQPWVQPRWFCVLVTKNTGKIESFPGPYSQFFFWFSNFVF